MRSWRERRECDAHAQLTDASRRARDQEAPDIGAADDQHKADGGDENHRDGADVADHAFVERLDEGIPALVGCRVLVRETDRDGGHLALRRLQCHAVEQPSHDGEVVRASAGQPRAGIHTQRQPQLGERFGPEQLR